MQFLSSHHSWLYHWALPKGKYGTTTAATVSRDILYSFPNIHIRLMVSIGGNTPSANQDVRLGNIMVSSQDRGQGSILQGLETYYKANSYQLKAHVAQILDKKPQLCKKDSQPSATSNRFPNPAHLIARPEHGKEDNNPTINYGLIASANQLIKDACIHNKLAVEKGIFCFKIEEASLINHFPYLQGFIAIIAAVYIKDLLQQILPNKVKAERQITEILNASEYKASWIPRTF
ncbi:hypothetical protein B0I35DRAFT_451749 [Stachybotrys elegans]|uniref:Nucleoside phosphorylase domain-containing protein n=1 Tax=Stachybotrys elegans TaxID=80388 RepID=A0A8K0WQ69_9HYPO|nr:hypothetical protein B0I35DRAFT_451749 [Stachybotrys elegans]